jgi:predicted nucleic acid-binding protein
MVLECCPAARADCVISGDRDLLTIAALLSMCDHDTG